MLKVVYNGGMNELQPIHNTVQRTEIEHSTEQHTRAIDALAGQALRHARMSFDLDELEDAHTIIRSNN